MSSAQTDYYQTLEVARDADGAVLKSAYRKLAMKYHPDRNPGDATCETKFKAINEAYDCLKDPQKRAAYDRYGHEAFTQGMNGGGGFGGGGFGGHDGFADIGDIFETIFGSAFGGGGAQRAAQLHHHLGVLLGRLACGSQALLACELEEAQQQLEVSPFHGGEGEGQAVAQGNLPAAATPHHTIPPAC